MTERTRAEAWSIFVEILIEEIEDQGLEPEDVLPTSTSDDLGLSSISAMHVMIALEERMDWKLDFQGMLTEDGEYPRDVTMGELFDFAYRMGTASAAGEAARTIGD